MMETEIPKSTPHCADFGDKSLFPNLPPAYLNHAAISPPSIAVEAQIASFLMDQSRGGVSGFKRWLPQLERLKAKLAAFLRSKNPPASATAKDIAFVENTTTGVAHLAMNLPWKKGDRVLLFEGDFPANITPWQRAAQLFELDIQLLPIEPFFRDLDAALDGLRRQLSQPTRLVATSFVRFQTGLRMPVETMGALCHEFGAELFVDGIQGIGSVPIDIEHIDYLACGGHKWLMGLCGLGFVYIDPSRVEQLVPRVAGWLSHENALSFLFEGPGELRHDRAIRKEASALELGAMSGIGAAALEASVDLIQQLSVPAIFEHINRYHDAIEPQLVELGFVSERSPNPALRSGSLCVRPPADVDLAELAGTLETKGVHLSTPDARLRFAPHWPNHLSETDLVVPSIHEALGR